MFVDHIKITAKAGDGGHGCVAFRREAFVPRGGPSGGDGGRGGSIILRADSHTDNLTAFFYEPIIKAKSGENGMGKECYGKAAPDKIVAVPQGTLVYRMRTDARSNELEPSVAYGTSAMFVDLEKSPEDEEKPAPGKKQIRPEDRGLIADLTEVGQEFVLCKGGEGGLGNVHFKSSRNRVPVQSTPGKDGEEGTFYLELRKIADVGLVGYPNAGKSTLLTKVSSARPKVAAYPFTTLTPHIGVVELPGYQRLTVADIPGLIEGAHENVGLGHEFLRHIVRCKLLAFVVDMAATEGRDPLADLKSLRQEIDLYDETLSTRPWFIVANKMDVEGADEQLKSFKRRFRRKIEIIPISAAEAQNIETLKQRLGELVGAVAV
jgi:GTP-binding protein